MRVGFEFWGLGAGLGVIWKGKARENTKGETQNSGLRGCAAAGVSCAATWSSLTDGCRGTRLISGCHIWQF